jgi:bifunctional non-homologous end joining protein LigD
MVGVRVWVDDLDGLLGLVEMDAVELHPWNATVDDIEHADRIVLDVDPGEGIEWDQVIETTLRFRDLLEEVDLESWPKISDGKGVHLMALSGLPRDLPCSLVRDALFKRRLVNERRDLCVLSPAPSARSDHMFLDYLRNGRGNMAVGAGRLALGLACRSPRRSLGRRWKLAFSRTGLLWRTRSGGEGRRRNATRQGTAAEWRRE